MEFFDEAMLLQYELTKRFSAEFSIRNYLLKYPDRTYASLKEWASDPNVHVRRLVSEGTRPSLPWAVRLPMYQQDPSRVIDLLELLKDDQEVYVRRSVANNLNDISKDHSDIRVATCRRWLKAATPERKWVVRHALRSLVKKGQEGARDPIVYARFFTHNSGWAWYATEGCSEHDDFIFFGTMSFNGCSGC